MEVQRFSLEIHKYFRPYSVLFSHRKFDVEVYFRLKRRDYAVYDRTIYTIAFIP